MAWKIAGTDGPRAGNHGGGIRSWSVAFQEGTGGASKGGPGAVSDSEGVFRHEEVRFGEFRGGNVGGRPLHSDG